MNLSQLRTFIEVVDQGSFSSAARALGLSQPAVTMQMQGLEAELGALLLDRRHRRIEPTEAGTALLASARRMLAELESAKAAIDLQSTTVSGHLEVAASTTPGQYVLPRLLGDFLKAFPEVTVALRVYDSADVVARVESGDAHLGMTGARVPNAKVDWAEFGADELVLICPPDSPLAVGARSLADVVPQPFIMRGPGSGTRSVFEQALRDRGIDPAALKVVMELGTSEAIVSAVEGGMGVGVVSRLAADKALALRTVGGVDAPGFPILRPFHVVSPRGSRTRATDALLAYLRERMSAELPGFGADVAEPVAP